MFCNNKAGNNGGAVYLLCSTLLTQQGTVMFYNNTADNGGAVYIGEGSSFYSNTTTVQFIFNSAKSYGAALYVELYGVHNITLVQQHYGRIGNSTTNGDKEVYIHTVFDQYHLSAKSNHYPGCDYQYEYTKALVYVNSTNFNKYRNEVQIWFHNLLLDPIAGSECFRDITYPLYCTFYCDDSDTYNCIIDSVHQNFTIVSNDTALNCSISHKGIVLNIKISDSKDWMIMFPINFWWNDYLGSCNKDISHVAVPGHGCVPLLCEILDSAPDGIDCENSDATFSPGYWNSNGFYYYVYPCPVIQIIHVTLMMIILPVLVIFNVVHIGVTFHVVNVTEMLISLSSMTQQNVFL